MNAFQVTILGALAGTVVGCAGASGQSSAPSVTNPPSEKPDHEAQHAGSHHAERAVSSSERAAYEKAKPIFDRYCSSCHTTAGSRSQGGALQHFDMDHYPFGGHHANEIAAAVRGVLGADGSKPSMPPDRPGAVEGEDLKLILAWASQVGASH
ncbi:MAG: hypothetical protein SFV15_19595 [Polyangiaceae bacterium]|nr:hypothetical protein [Polyangiaceae bacterium]